MGWIGTNVVWCGCGILAKNHCFRCGGTIFQGKTTIVPYLHTNSNWLLATMGCNCKNTGNVDERMLRLSFSKMLYNSSGKTSQTHKRMSQTMPEKWIAELSTPTSSLSSYKYPWDLELLVPRYPSHNNLSLTSFQAPLSCGVQMALWDCFLVFFCARSVMAHGSCIPESWRLSIHLPICR